VINIKPASEVEIYHVNITTMFFSFISCLSNMLDVILALHFLNLSPHFLRYVFSVIYLCFAFEASGSNLCFYLVTSNLSFFNFDMNKYHVL